MFSTTKTLLSDEKITELAAKAFGANVQVVEISEITGGLFNAIYSLKLSKPVQGADEVILKLGVQDGKFVLDYEKEIMKAELFVYDRLPKAGIPVPKVYFSDVSRELIDCDYFFMEKMMGDTWQNLMGKITPENSAELQTSLGEYTARLHSITGGYFGYIKADERYRFATWQEAFRSFIDRMVEDGKKQRLDLPYDDLYAALEPHWHLLDEVKTPSLVNFDMWAKNIMLKQVGGKYIIDGIIDHERAFFGDPVGEFISTETICGSLDQAGSFRKGYETVRPLAFGKNEKIRMQMYNLYMGLMVAVEVYRDRGSEEESLKWRSGWLKRSVEQLKRL